MVTRLEATGSGELPPPSWPGPLQPSLAPERPCLGSSEKAWSDFPGAEEAVRAENLECQRGVGQHLKTHGEVRTEWNAGEARIGVVWTKYTRHPGEGAVVGAAVLPSGLGLGEARGLRPDFTLSGHWGPRSSDHLGTLLGCPHRLVKEAQTRLRD